ncbi:MFS transporter [Kitasatospora sp. NPDC058201]|uniref:MFS transporter n=1 Tax=unclassified Kitasatospora TaxID=2633591 RepID=UPI00366594F6
MRVSLGRRFGWLWGAYAVSALGTRLAFNALPLIAIDVLAAGPAEVSVLAAAGAAVGAAVALPLGPWAERRRKRPVMITMDLLRCAALLSVPAGYALGLLTFPQLLLVSVLVAAADITFGAAAGACLKALVRPEDLLTANARFEATSWTAIVLGLPLGGVAIGLFGPVVTVLADAGSYLLSAAGLRAIGGGEPRPAPAPVAPPRARDLFEGWRHLLAHPVLRPLFLNTVLVNALIMAVEPLLAVLLLRRLGLAPWQYGLAFAVPCLGGLIGSRIAGRAVARFGRHRVLLVAGSLRACWPVGLAFVGPGTGGLVLVTAVEFALITCLGVFNPVLATHRLEEVAPDHMTRVLTAWSVTAKAAVAALTALWGLLAVLVGLRQAIALAGLLLLVTPVLLPRRPAAPRLPDAAPQGAGRAG